MICSVAWEALGTQVDMITPLMSAGLDSLAATDFARTLSTSLGLDVSPTMLFDHPTLDSVVTFLSADFGSALACGLQPERYHPHISQQSSLHE
ncbi:acyl carrier protein [bacterium]|nr:acyl carrier protein [bacterium]